MGSSARVVEDYSPSNQSHHINLRRGRAVTVLNLKDDLAFVQTQDGAKEGGWIPVQYLQSLQQPSSGKTTLVSTSIQCHAAAVSVEVSLLSLLLRFAAAQSSVLCPCKSNLIGIYICMYICALLVNICHRIISLPAYVYIRIDLM